MMPRKRKRHCRGKIRHTTLAFAEAHAARVNNTGHGIVEPYKCRLCEYYHVGHARRKARRMRTENHHVRTEREWLRGRFIEGVNQGVELEERDYPGCVREMYATRTPYERGVMLAALLKELGDES